MFITSTEVKKNMGRCLKLAQTEDIFITKNGKVTAKLTNPFNRKMEIAKSLIGVVPDGISYEEAREERLGKI